jgi:hypothetical protein
MRAEYLEDSTIAVSGSKRTETFTRIWAGVGWPDGDSGYVCVVGERTDGLYHCLWEKSGGLWEIGEAIVVAKDRFLIDCVWVDTGDELATSYLRTLEGLCFYENQGKQPASFAGTGSKSRWPDFRDADTTASIVAVPSRIANNFRSALEKTRGVIMTGKLMIHESNCPKLVYTLRQPLHDLLASSVMQALVWVVSALDAATDSGPLDFDPASQWYANFSRILK